MTAVIIFLGIGKCGAVSWTNYPYGIPYATDTFLFGDFANKTNKQITADSLATYSITNKLSAGTGVSLIWDGTKYVVSATSTNLTQQQLAIISMALTNPAAFDIAGAADAAIAQIAGSNYLGAAQVGLQIGSSNLVTQTQATSISNSIVGQIPSLTGYATLPQVTNTASSLIGSSNLVTQAQATSISNVLFGQIPSLADYATLTNISATNAITLTIVTNLSNTAMTTATNFALVATNNLNTAIHADIASTNTANLQIITNLLGILGAASTNFSTAVSNGVIAQIVLATNGLLSTNGNGSGLTNLNAANLTNVPFANTNGAVMFATTFIDVNGATMTTTNALQGWNGADYFNLTRSMIEWTNGSGVRSRIQNTASNMNLTVAFDSSTNSLSLGTNGAASISMPFLTTSATQSTPATNEFVTAAYVQSINQTGPTFYNSTNLDGTNTYGTTNYVYSATIPPQYFIQYGITNAGQYLNLLVVTNIVSFSGPFVVTEYVKTLTTGGAKVLTCHHEVYYSTNNGATLQGDWSGPSFAVNYDGTTNLIQSVVVVPFTSPGTNCSVYTMLKIDSVNHVTGVQCFGGTNTPAAITFNTTYGQLGGVYQPFSANLTPLSVNNGSNLTNLAPTIVTATNFVYAPGGSSNVAALTVLAYTNNTGQVTYSVQDDDRSLPITNDDRTMSLTNVANIFWGKFTGLGSNLTNSNGSGFTSDIDGSALTHTNPNNIFSGNSANISNVIIGNNLIFTNSTGLIQISNSAAGFCLMTNTMLTSSNHVVRGTVTVSGNTTLTGTLSVGGATTITGASTYTGAVTMSAGATWGTTLNGSVATSTSSCSNYVGTNGIFQRLTLGQYIFPFTNIVIIDGTKGCSFLYTNTTNPLIFFTNINIGVDYTLTVVQTNSGASGGPWNFTNWQGGNNNSWVCWPGTNVMNPATNFGSRALYKFTAFPGYGTLGTNVLIYSATTNF